MTVLNKRTWFGSYATVHTTLFNCMVSTAPGLLRTTTLVTALGPGDKPKGWPLAKAYLRRGFLSKRQRDAVHDYIVNLIDQAAKQNGKGTNIGYALEGV